MATPATDQSGALGQPALPAEIWKQPRDEYAPVPKRGERSQFAESDVQTWQQRRAEHKAAVSAALASGELDAKTYAAMHADAYGKVRSAEYAKNFPGVVAGAKLAGAEAGTDAFPIVKGADGRLRIGNSNRPPLLDTPYNRTQLQVQSQSLTDGKNFDSLARHEDFGYQDQPNLNNTGQLIQATAGTLPDGGRLRAARVEAAKAIGATPTQLAILRAEQATGKDSPNGPKVRQALLPKLQAHVDALRPSPIATADDLAQALVQHGLQTPDGKRINSADAKRLAGIADTFAQQQGVPLNKVVELVTRADSGRARRQWGADAETASGATTFDPDTLAATLHLIKNADPSTVVHEFFHAFLPHLNDAHRTALEREFSRAAGNVQALPAWARGVATDPGQVRDAAAKFDLWNPVHLDLFHEWGARSFEQYLRAGQAPTSALGKVFEQLKGWLSQIYKSVTGTSLDTGMSAETRRVFDEMLGGDGKTGDRRLETGDLGRKAGALTLESPTVAQLNAEQARAAQRQAIAEGQGKALKGGAIDTTGDLLDGTKADNPLFAAKTPERKAGALLSRPDEKGDEDLPAVPPEWVGKRLRDVSRDLPRDPAEPRLLDVGRSNTEIAQDAGREFQGWQPKLKAADGSDVLLHNPEGGSQAARVRHLIFDNQSGRLDASKAEWLPMVPDTLAQAQLRLVDDASGNRLFVRQYSDGNTHLVVVAPDGTVQDQQPFSGKLITQFPNEIPNRRGNMRVDWVRWETGIGRSQGNPAPTPAGSTSPGSRQPEFQRENTPDTGKVKPGAAASSAATDQGQSKAERPLLQRRKEEDPSVEAKGGSAGASDAELNAAVDRATAGKKSPILAVGAARDAAAKLDPTRRGVPSKMDEARAIGRALWTKYTEEPKFDDYMQAKGKWDGARQIAQFNAMKLKKEFDKAHDDRAQEGIFNWIEAGGDAETLRNWAAQTNDPKLRDGYQRALNLSPTEVRDAQALQNYWTTARQFAVDNGLWINFLQNYATHIHQNDNPVVRGILGDYLYGKLSTRFQYAKSRVFPSAFEAEQEGFPLKTKKAGEVAAIWSAQMNKTLADRGWIKDNLDVKAADGRPIFAVAQGTGKVMEPRAEWAAAFPGKPESKVFYEEAGQTRDDADRYAKQFPGMTVTERASQPPVMVKPFAKTEMLSDYVTSGHPALRKWVYAATTPEGSPVFVESQVLVHPHYVKDVENALGSSKLNEIPIVRGLTALQSSMKQTMLSASFFHPFQIGIHALEHKTFNLANLEEIDPNNPAQRSLIEHGLNIGAGSVRDGLGGNEGLMGGGGLLAKIPVIGKKLIQPLNDWTFHEFIPRIKMTTGLEALARNRETYAKDVAAGKITDHQIIAKTAAEMNAAFGELNYNMLGRNPSLQHFLRLTLLAPDFLEARGRFVGQAAKPFGAEQRWALARGAVAMFVAARVANYFTGEDDPKRRPFSIIKDGREYGVRTVQGDILHLIHDPRGFAFGRVSPLLGKSGLEVMTGRDAKGEPVSTGDLFGDLAKGWIPLTFRRGADRN